MPLRTDFSLAPQLLQEGRLSSDVVVLGVLNWPRNPVFPRRDRFSRTAFTLALKRGARFSSKHLSMVVFEGAHGYAVVIPKKVVRLSTDRHRLKRQILETLKKQSLPPSVIVFLKKRPSGVHYQDVAQELQNLLSSR